MAGNTTDKTDVQLSVFLHSMSLDSICLFLLRRRCKTSVVGEVAIVCVRKTATRNKIVDNFEVRSNVLLQCTGEANDPGGFRRTRDSKGVFIL